MKRKIMMILSIMTLILFSGCTNYIGDKHCSKLKVMKGDEKYNIYSENKLCIVEEKNITIKHSFDIVCNDGFGNVINALVIAENKSFCDNYRNELDLDTICGCYLN